MQEESFDHQCQIHLGTNKQTTNKGSMSNSLLVPWLACAKQWSICLGMSASLPLRVFPLQQIFVGEHLEISSDASKQQGQPSNFVLVCSLLFSKINTKLPCHIPHGKHWLVVMRSRRFCTCIERCDLFQDELCTPFAALALCAFASTVARWLAPWWMRIRCNLLKW